MAGLAGGMFDHRAVGWETPAAPSNGNSCVFIFLFGGPSHIDLWDMKPNAPAEIRGDFQPVSTKVPGIHICEHLPLMAQQMDKFCLLRSTTHHMPVHGPACSEVYTGREYFGPPVTDQATPQDWPSLTSLVTRFGPQRSGLPNTVVLPWYTQFVGQDRRIAGQTGARMGEQFNPFLVQSDVSDPKFEVQGLRRPDDVTDRRFQQRRQLFQTMQSTGRRVIERTQSVDLIDGHYQKALSMIGNSQAAVAFDLQREPPKLRDRYGRTRFGQSLLLARRLIEAGVSLVNVNWDDNHKDDKVSPHWDTHVENFPKLKDRLAPPFDRAFSAFVADMHERGLLEKTMVVALGEFGRTPKIGAITQNGMTKKTGRDHWPHAFTTLAAGGPVRGGQAYGSTVGMGGYVKTNPVTPADLTATILKHLGIDRSLQYADQFLQVEQRLCIGKPVEDLA